jgi:hypothetical protein
VSGVQAHWPAVQTKRLAGGVGQPQELLPPQPLLIWPQALPSAGVGQAVAVQQVFGLLAVSQTWPPMHPQLIVLPQPLSNVPQASPPVAGPFGTLAQVYGTFVGLLHWHTPVVLLAVAEQTWPLLQPQSIVPPTPSSRFVPHFPAYGALEQLSGALQTPGPSVPATHLWSVHQHLLVPVQLHALELPQPVSTGLWVMLHSPPTPPLPVQFAAPWQQTLPMHDVPRVQLPPQPIVAPSAG